MNDQPLERFYRRPAPLLDSPMASTFALADITTSSLLDKTPRRNPSAFVLAMAGAFVFHGALFAVAWQGGGAVKQLSATKAAVTGLVEVELAPSKVAEPAPRPEPLPEPPPARPTPRPTAPAEPSQSEPSQGEPSPSVNAPSTRATKAPRNEPLPAAAQAGQVLAAPDAIADFSDTFVVGKGANYAGGVTHGNGTSGQAVHQPNAEEGGVQGGKGTSTPANQANDRSRPPKLAGTNQWNCPFPALGDEAGVDRALVTLEVEVDARGKVLTVRALSDPGHGFARQARQCAFDKAWLPGLNSAGQPRQAKVIVKVAFER